MLERKDVLSIPYLKKTTFTGSYEGLRFRFSLIKKEALAEDGAGLGKETEQLEVTAWEGPYCFGVTPEEQMQRLETEFSEEGIQQGIDWLNGLWAAEPEKWIAAKGNWGKRP